MKTALGKNPLDNVPNIEQLPVERRKAKFVSFEMVPATQYTQAGILALDTDGTIWFSPKPFGMNKAWIAVDPPEVDRVCRQPK